MAEEYRRLSRQQEVGLKADLRQGKSNISSYKNPKSMREQHTVSKLAHSPRRPAKSGEKSDENGKSKGCCSKDTKAKSDDGSSSSGRSIVERQDKRKSLQVLQPSADGQKLLVGGRTKQKPKSKQSGAHSQQCSTKSRQKHLKSYLVKASEVESPSSASDADSNVNVDLKLKELDSTEETRALMVQEKAPEKYWELIAEERRKALEETLKENIMLYEEIEKLKSENAILKEKANNLEYFATLYKITKDNFTAVSETTTFKENNG
ncbi:uncharacterized protein LOC124442176 isoform X1 [Xenia sp. Carnegie-2017]|uniref:uncharacterized protein LOC124442176 isoform X1 n=1 Tax=Xenia sp. Carnegie-2017 TaxID=2897299 RepID=UPI001F034479|nr:uncharacterized protein LOC124442176 isoform X1 [Xenia sp. Carnegie-2017]